MSFVRENLFCLPSWEVFCNIPSRYGQCDMLRKKEKTSWSVFNIIGVHASIRYKHRRSIYVPQAKIGPTTDICRKLLQERNAVTNYSISEYYSHILYIVLTEAIFAWDLTQFIKLPRKYLSLDSMVWSQIEFLWLACTPALRAGVPMSAHRTRMAAWYPRSQTNVKLSRITPWSV